MVEPEHTDEELLEIARDAPEADTRAFDALVRRHQAAVRANCRSLTRSDDSDDLAQEVFVKVFYGLARFEGRASFRTWLYRIKANHCMNFVQRVRAPAKRHVDLEGASEADLAVDPKARRLLERDDDRERIAAVLESIGETLRVPLVLRDMDGMAYQEIADLLGIGLSAVKMRIKRGREEFRAKYDAPAAGYAAPAPEAGR